MEHSLNQMINSSLPLQKFDTGNPAADKSNKIHLLEHLGLLALKDKQSLLAEDIFSALLKKRNAVTDLVGLGQALYQQSRLNLAEEYYLSALEKIKSPCILLFIVYRALGDIHVLKKNFCQAEEYYNKASTLNPFCQNLIFHRGMMHLKEKNHHLAKKHFQVFLKTNPQSAKAWLGLALVRKALRDEELALACLHRSLDFDPENQQALDTKKRWDIGLQMLSSNLKFTA